MPLTGEYEPSTSAWSRKQTELYEATNGEQGGDLRGRPVIVLTSVGAKTGKLRKTALMRVEHDGDYAVVASLGGAPQHPVWYYNLKAHPHVELQDGAAKRDYTAREVTGDEKAALVGARRRHLARLRHVPDQDGPADPGVRARTDGLGRELGSRHPDLLWQDSAPRSKGRAHEALGHGAGRGGRGDIRVDGIGNREPGIAREPRLRVRCWWRWSPASRSRP